MICEDHDRWDFFHHIVGEGGKEREGSVGFTHTRTHAHNTTNTRTASGRLGFLSGAGRLHWRLHTTQDQPNNTMAS